ncbi:hypothetical protein ACFQ8W_15440 [Streptomyces sp. NPDC056508]|uniref:hypothetical protein n=1 Tax=Streptomyces sp. NPDC056508 TaxID=3345845 RepID=UPI00368A2634
MDVEAVALAAAALVAEGALGEAGRATWEGLARMTSLLRSRLPGQQAEVALSAVESRPRDEAAQQVLSDRIITAMSVDEDFRAQVEALVSEAQRNETTANVVARSVNDYRGARIGKVVNVDTVNGNLNF